MDPMKNASYADFIVKLPEVENFSSLMVAIEVDGPNEERFICRFCSEITWRGKFPNVSILNFWLQLKSLKKFPKLHILNKDFHCESSFYIQDPTSVFKSSKYFPFSSPSCHCIEQAWEENF